MYLIVAALLLFAPGLHAQSAESAAKVAARVTVLADEYVQEYLRTFPAAAALAGLTEGPHDRFDANMPAALRAWRAREDRWA
jgi:hypothetical protein